MTNMQDVQRLIGESTVKILKSSVLTDNITIQTHVRYVVGLADWVLVEYTETAATFDDAIAKLLLRLVIDKENHESILKLEAQAHQLILNGWSGYYSQNTKRQ